MELSSQNLHRLVKLLLDSGEARSTAQADALFNRYWVRVDVDPDVAESPTQQAILLTVLTTAVRAFRRQVKFTGALDVSLMVAGFEGQTLRDVIGRLGVHEGPTPMEDVPTIRIGCGNTTAGNGTAICPIADGWRAGIVGAGCRSPLKAGVEFLLAGVAAGAMAVSEAFHILRGDLPEAGHRVTGISLWRPELVEDWAGSESDGPPNQVSLPQKLWIVGLGHLGQAYCWALRFLPFGDGNVCTLWLQDVDDVSESTWSTSVLTDAADVGEKKTRVVARCMEQCGFSTRIVERRFSEHTRLELDEPRVALFGVDNAATRRAMEAAGFGLVIEAGLGSGYRDFHAIRMHAFPGPVTAAERWSRDNGVALSEELAPAYADMLRAGEDACGVTMLASRAVGAPFVGCFAATLVVGELLKRGIGGTPMTAIDLSLRNLRRRETLALGR